MPIIRTFVCHHGGDLDARVRPILRRVAPLGIRPWIDKHDTQDKAGLPLAKVLHDAISHGTCKSLSLFLTKDSVTRKWIEQEVQWALQKHSEGVRILPIWLDPPDEIELPASFREFLEHRKVLWLEPEKDPRFMEKYSASVFAVGGISQETTELTLYLGHRSPHWEAALPEVWAQCPALHVRLELCGDQDFSPQEVEWREIETGLATIRSNLPGLERINICGQAPLGVGAIIGKVWDRSSGIKGPMQLRTFNMKSGQIWATEPKDFDLTNDWTPEKSQFVKMECPATLRHSTLLFAFSPLGREEEFLRHIQRWNDQRPQPSRIHCAIIPCDISSPAQAQQVLREMVGVVRFLRRTYYNVEVIELITGFPLALTPLFTYHLRNAGPLHLYDEVKRTHDYRLATIIQ